MTRIPTQAELLALFDYDAATGMIRRRKRARHCPASNIAGYIGGNGYRRIRVFGVLHEAPKLIWTMVTGEWPDLIVDHIDTYGPKADWGDRWENLRLATGSENAFNKRKHRLSPGEAVAVIASLCVSCWAVIGFAVFLILRMFGAL